MNILQRNSIKKFDNNDPSTYPSNPEQRRKLMAQQKLEVLKKAAPKKVKPIEQPILKIDPYIPINPIQKPERDPVLEELERKVLANKEKVYQEKVKNNSTGLRYFDPIKVSRDD